MRALGLRSTVSIMNNIRTLLPPIFSDFGPSMSIEEAIKQGRWIATVNLWVLQTEPVPSILYQQRSSAKSWAPEKLDVVAGGKVDEGESLIETLLRETKEEIGLEVSPHACTYVGKRLHVGETPYGFQNTVLNLYVTVNNQPLSEYVLQKEEVSGIYALDIDQLLKLHRGELENFLATGLSEDGSESKINVTPALFPENWDNYHQKIAELAKKYFQGVADIVY